MSKITIAQVAKLPEKKYLYCESDYVEGGQNARNFTIDEISQIPIDEEALKKAGYIHKSKLLGVEEVEKILEKKIDEYDKIPNTHMTAYLAKSLVQAQEKGINNENRN